MVLVGEDDLFKKNNLIPHPEAISHFSNPYDEINPVLENLEAEFVDPEDLNTVTTISKQFERRIKKLESEMDRKFSL